jgi:D-alanyl-D-alanine carboxypeptidase (penicillin-binding protein 5/6)
MMRSALFAVLFAALAIGPAAAQSREGGAQHVTIMDAESGAILFCDNCEAPIPPASMSKLMTVLIVLDQLRAGSITMETRFTVSERAWREFGAPSSGSHMFLPVNSTVSVRDLLYGAVIVSANDACVVLAEGLAGSEAAFVELMNERARQLGLETANFTNATGLDDPEHRISSADLARLARHIIVNYPEFYRVYSQPSFTYNNRTQANRNPLLGAFEGADGMKTGHTDESGYGLIGSATQGDQRRIIVFNGARSMAERRSEAVRLMTTAFQQYNLTRIANEGDEVGRADVWLGSRGTVPLLAQSNIVVGAPRALRASLSAHIEYDGPIHPPIREGDVVARLVVTGPGFATQEFPLVAGRDVGRANWFARAWEGLRLSVFGP